MGYYLNSEADVDASKRVILAAIPSRRRITLAEALEAPEPGHVRLALVINGRFNALGILYDRLEAEGFTQPDSRERLFFDVLVEEIKPFVSERAIAAIKWEPGGRN